jgi:uncharacterized protein YbaA (DUF1428 family)
MPYVDGFVFPIPKKNVAAYRRMATKAGHIWLEHGALEYRECIGDDLDPKGKGASFPKRMRAKRGETVGFAWVVYRSRAQRDRVIRKVLADPRLAAMMDPKNSPFDFRKMLYGGFKVIVDL